MPIDIAGAGGGHGLVAADDIADGMQCNEHPYRKNSPIGICAVCLQEKLGKLVSSSSSSSSSFMRSSSVSSYSPSFRSDHLRLTPCSNADVINRGGAGNHRHNHHHHEGKNGRRARLPFLPTQKKTNKKAMNMIASSNSGDNNNVVLKRSKSTSTPRSTRYFPSDFSPRRRGFWSFLHLSHKKLEKPSTQPPPETSSATAVVVVVDEEDGSPNSSGSGSNTTSFGRKVSRSRSVGCGSRSFSGDFFERISTGFGDCTLRRVESQREGRRSTSGLRAGAGDAMKDRVPCGGLFGGFVVTSSSSSSSWVSSVEDGSGPGPMLNGRNRNRAWAFASPRRAFAKSNGNREIGGFAKSSYNTSSGAPKLAAIPSLLAARGCPIAGE